MIKLKSLVIYTVILIIVLVGVVGSTMLFVPGADAEIAYYRGQYEKCMVVAGNLGFTKIDAIGICRASVLEAVRYDAFGFTDDDFLEWNEGSWITLKE